jgi:hypothetical protein
VILFNLSSPSLGFIGIGIGTSTLQYNAAKANSDPIPLVAQRSQTCQSDTARRAIAE